MRNSLKILDTVVQGESRNNIVKNEVRVIH